MYMYSSSFPLYHPTSNESTITIGDKGIVINEYDDFKQFKCYTHILYDDIHCISNDLTLHTAGYYSFKIKACPLVKPRKLMEYEIKMLCASSSKLVFNMIQTFMFASCRKRDNMIGIN